MNIERRIEQLEQDFQTLLSNFRLTNKIVTSFGNSPEELKNLFDTLVKGADAMAEIKGKVEEMRNRIDSNERWMRFSYKILWGLIAIIAACAIKISFWGIP